MSDEPPMDPETEVLRQAVVVTELEAIRRKHAQRKAVTNPHPVFPTEPDAA